MALNRYIYSLAFVLLATGCSSRYNDDVISETYVHRYGVPLPAEEWAERGQHGQVVSTLKDGVVVSTSYDSGVLNGETTYTFPHRDTIHKREVYVNGVLQEEYWNHPSGIPSRQVTHQSPTNNSVTVWYETGAPQSKEEYVNNQLVSGEYFTVNQMTESLVENQNGNRIKRDPFGNLISLDEIRDGQMVLSTGYYPNGTPKSICTHANGIPHGERRTFLPSGEPDTIEQWNNGYQHGKTTTFQSGEKYSELPYVNGQKHGVETIYRDDGNTVVREVNWNKGYQHGPTYSYVGDTTKTDWYFQDRPVNKQTFDVLSSQ